MDLAYVLLTVVDCDDLADGGAAHVAKTVRSVRVHSPETLVEVLVGNFAGQQVDVDAVVQQGRPDQMCLLITSRWSPICSAPCVMHAAPGSALSRCYAGRRLAGADVTKTSLMVGCGETESDVHEAMARLRDSDVEVLTIGQYLRPTPKHARLTRYVDPEEVEAYKARAEELGFAYVASGPLVRSSYRAAAAFLKYILRGEQAPFDDRYGERRLEVIG